jgi:hypothetical protein
VKAMREGYFNAYARDIGVRDSGENNLATVSIHFDLTEELDRGAEGSPDTWRDISGEKLEITGYFYLENKKGELNVIALERLKEAFGWDGRDPMWLQDSAETLRERPVQLKLSNEEYKGKQKLRVEYLNPYGREPQDGGVMKGNGEKRTALVNRLVPKLLAHASSGAAAPPAAPAKPPRATKPKAATVPPPPSEPPPPPVAPPPEPGSDDGPITESTEAQAWGAFFKTCPAAWTVQQKQKEWFRVMNKLFPGRQASQLTAAEWATMETAGLQEIIPM